MISSSLQPEESWSQRWRCGGGGAGGGAVEEVGDAATGRHPRRPRERQRGGGAGRGAGTVLELQARLRGDGGLGTAPRRRQGGRRRRRRQFGRGSGGKSWSIWGFCPQIDRLKNIKPSSSPCARHTAHDKEFSLSQLPSGPGVWSLPCACTRQRNELFA